MQRRAEGIIFNYQIDDNPANSEIKQPGKDVDYKADGPTTYSHHPDAREGVPPGNATGAGDQTENVPPASSRVIPDKMKDTLREQLTYSASQVASRFAARKGRPGVSKWTAQAKVHEQLRDAEYGSAKVLRQVGSEWLVSYQTYEGEERKVLVGGHEDDRGRVSLSVRRAAHKTADTLTQLISQSQPIILQRSKAVPLTPLAFSPKKGIWKWKASGSKGRTYTVTVKALKKGNIKSLLKAPVMVNCTCPYFRWWGPEHWAKVDKYQYKTRSVKPQGTVTFPVMRDPEHVKPICKHIAAAIESAGSYRLASDSGWEISGAPTSPYRVAFRYAAQLGRDPSPESLTRYSRLRVVFDLSKSKELDKILSVAARVSGSIPFMSRNHPHEIAIDMPVGVDVRGEVAKALKRLPFVKSVVGGSGGRI